MFRKFLAVCLLILSASVSFGYIGNTNNGTATDTIWSGPLPAINAMRFTASSNEVVDTVYAKVGGLTGHYKCAIYGGSSSRPNTLLGTTTEITNPTNGWYSFSLNTPVSITNASIYWLAIWSESSSGRVYYTPITGASLVWMDRAYGDWPTNWVTTSSSTVFNYCIYAARTAPQPPPSHSTVVLSWQAPPTNYVSSYDILATTNLMRPFFVFTNLAGNTTSLTLWKTNLAPMMFFRVLANTYNIRTNTSSVTVAWDYLCNGDTNDVLRYNVYYGTNSRAYPSLVSVGPCTNRTATISNLFAGNTYYFAATAVDRNLLESDYSSEVTFVSSAITNVGSVYVPQRIAMP